MLANFPSHPGTLLICSIILWSAGAASAIAEDAKSLIAKGDALDRKQETHEALAAYLEADKAQPDQAALLVKIAKQYGDLMTEAKGAAERRQASGLSIAWSKRALAVDPKSSDANLAVAISIGKSVEFMGNRAKIEASRQIRTSADRALELNPRSDYAHHMLGRWHQGLAGMGGATRMIAEAIYGKVPDASYDEALAHFKKARELRPDRLIHQIEYGRTLAMMGRKDEARTEIRKGLAMPNRDKDDAESKQRGADTLKGL